MPYNTPPQHVFDPVQRTILCYIPLSVVYNMYWIKGHIMKAKTQQMKLWPARERVPMIDDMERDAEQRQARGAAAEK